MCPILSASFSNDVTDNLSIPKNLRLVKSVADREILKRGDALCQPPAWLADEENFKFEMV